MWSFVRTFWTAAQRWVDDRCPSMAAAVAFYSAFSLAPTLVIAVAVGGIFLGPDAVRGQLVGELRGLLGEDGARAVQGMIESAWLGEAIGLKALLSLATLLVGASATFAELSDDVNRIWRRELPPAPALWSFVRVRLVSLALVIGIGFLLVVSLVMDAALKALQDTMWPPDPATRLLAAVGAHASSFVLLGVMFALLLRALPSGPVRWREVLLGAFVASALFTVGKSFFGLYLARAGTADAFGAAGSLAVILMWLFYSAAVFLYGAVFAHVRTEPR